MPDTLCKRLRKRLSSSTILKGCDVHSSTESLPPLQSRRRTHFPVMSTTSHDYEDFLRHHDQASNGMKHTRRSFFARTAENTSASQPKRRVRALAEDDDKRRSVHIALALPPDYLDTPPTYSPPTISPEESRRHGHVQSCLTTTALPHNATTNEYHQSRAPCETQPEIDWAAYYESLAVPTGTAAARASSPNPTSRWSRDLSSLSKPFEAGPESPVHPRTSQTRVRNSPNINKLLPPPPPATASIEPTDLAYFYGNSTRTSRR